MEDHDDFEFVDNDKTNFDELVDEDTLLRNDELGAISHLNREMKEVEELKKQLKSQCMESQQLIQTLKDQNSVNTELQTQLKQQMKSVSDLEVSLRQEKQQFMAQKQQLSELLSSMARVPSDITKSNQLIAKLNKFYRETSTIETEITKLKAMRSQQEQMINECKINIERINSHQRECLMSLDKSKSFACKECGTDIGLKDDIESKCYQVGQGQFTEKKRGYLFQNAVNTVLGSSKTENFTTGSYQISWVQCAKCNTQMGWKYISADSPTNTSKVGKYCLARYSLTSPEDRAQK
eukprot:1095_1